MSTHDKAEGNIERSQRLLDNFSEETFTTALERAKADKLIHLPGKNPHSYEFTEAFKNKLQGPWQLGFMQGLFDSINSVQEGTESKWPVMVDEHVQASLLDYVSSNMIVCSVNIDNFTARVDSLGSRAVRKLMMTH